MAMIANGPDETEQRIEGRIVPVVREFAREVGGDRAANAVTVTASLERDVGLGSLERVELLMRLEVELDRELDDRFLLLDTPREIAHAVPAAPVLRAVVPAPREQPTAMTDVDATGSDPALIQYTSGSTGDPKGVLLTHANHRDESRRETVVGLVVPTPIRLTASDARR